MSESFHVNFKFPGPVVLELTIFSELLGYNVTSINKGQFLNNIKSMYEKRILDELNRIKISNTGKYIYFSFPGPVVLEKKIFNFFSYINMCKNGFPYYGPTRPPGAMILTNLYLHYVRKLPYKFQLSWPSGSGEEDF